MNSPVFAFSFVPIRCRHLLLAGLGVLAAASLQAQQVSGFDAQTMLQKLESMKNVQQQARQQVLNDAFKQVQAGAASQSAAWNLYLDAVKATRFSGKVGGAGDFQEWKKTEGDKLKSSALQHALQFHLRYLGLTLRKANDEKSDALLRDVNAYVRDLAAADADFAKELGTKGEGAALLSKSVGDSVFIGYLKLDGQLGKMSDWEMSPGNISGILDKALRPALREARNPSLPQTWDWQIELERARETSGRLALAKEKFEHQRIPSLKWSRAQEFIVLGSPQQAAVEMFAIIQANPQHPDAAKWMNDLEHLLREQSAPAAPPASGEVPPVNEAPQG